MKKVGIGLSPKNGHHNLSLTLPESYESFRNFIDISYLQKKKQNTVHPELVEGRTAKAFMLRPAQHERPNFEECVFSIMG